MSAVTLKLDGREILLVGTAHVSQQSVDLFREVVNGHITDILEPITPFLVAQ